MEVTFLGTGSAYPSPHRGASALILHHKIDGSQWLFDCGEGTQIQMQKSKKSKFGKLNKIFITHLHGDHLYGLPGLLASIGTIGGKDDFIEIYGPLGLKKYIRTVFGLVSENIMFKYKVNEINPQVAFEKQWKTRISLVADDPPLSKEIESEEIPVSFNKVAAWKLLTDDATRTSVWAVPLKHTVPCIGYVVLSQDKPGKLNASLARKLGVKNGPDMGFLKMGQDVTLENGDVIKATDVLSDPLPGINIGIMGDSCDSSALVEFMKRDDINVGSSKLKLNYLVHECTLQNEMEEECIFKGHSTPRMVADWASQLDVDTLILTHFSHRYTYDEATLASNANLEQETVTEEILKKQIEESKLFAGSVLLAKDLTSFEIR